MTKQEKIERLKKAIAYDMELYIITGKEQYKTCFLFNIEKLRELKKEEAKK